MRSEEIPLDLNHLPDEHGERWRDGKQVSEESVGDISIECIKEKSDDKEGKEEKEKVYECRFCSLKFCKSQALGGHMNRHRQERETETLNRARQLVFGNENLATHTSHIGLRDPSVHFRPVYPRPTSPSSSSILSSPYLYPSPPRFLSFPSSYHPPPPSNDYYIGHVLSASSHRRSMPSFNTETNYACTRTPLGHGFATPDSLRHQAARGTALVLPHSHIHTDVLSLNCGITDGKHIDTGSIAPFREDY